MSRKYEYVGPRQLVKLASSTIDRLEPKSEVEFAQWLTSSYGGSAVTLTYVVTLAGSLRVSDRHSEHVACAQGKPVLGAGELSVWFDPKSVEIESVTNQSTGYCPEPVCFAAVATAIEGAGLVAPESFSHDFIFRRCPSCDLINLVKDADFECAACGSELPYVWNFAEADDEDQSA